MNTHLQVRTTETVIARRGMATFRNIRGAQLHVVQGHVWLTQSGSTQDICLGAGESFRITRNGLTIVCACHLSPAALVRLEQPAPAPARSQRFRDWLCVLLASSSQTATSR